MIDFAAVVPKIDAILARGLSRGVGERGGQVCVEAAICEALDLPHGDDPGCVVADVRRFKIGLNDAAWSSPQARANGLRSLAIAQLGTKDALRDGEFARLITEKTIRVLISTLFREVLSDDDRSLEAAKRCELEGTSEAAVEAAWAARAARAAGAARAAEAAEAAEAAGAAVAAGAAWAARAAEAAVAAGAASSDQSDKYLLLSAKLALEALVELKAPGVAYL